MIVQLKNLGGSGYIADMPAHELPEQPLAWSVIRNMTFRDGLAERVEGYAAGFDTTPSETLYGLIAVEQADGTPYIVGGADAAIYCYSGTTETDITGTTNPAATADTKWTFCTLTGFVIGNSSVAAPQYIAISSLGGATNVADLSNWPALTTCKVLRSYKYFLVAGYMTESGTAYPYKVRWSNSATPGTLPSTWVAAASNLAGSVDLSADDGPIVDMLDFGDMLAIYRASGVTLMRYTGGSEVMTFNRVPSASGGGLIGNNCVVDVPQIGHVCLSQSDLYVFNGTAIQSVLDGKIRRWYQSTVDETRGHRSFVVHHATRSEVWACFPESGETDCTAAIVWNYRQNTVGTREIPNATAGVHAIIKYTDPTTWATVSGTWDSLTSTWDGYDAASKSKKTVLASTANKLYVIGAGTDAAGSALVGQLERTGISLGDAQRVKYIRSIWPRFDATAGQQIEISVGTSMSADEAPTWQSAQTYTVGTSRKVNVNATGRFLALRVRSASGGVWKLGSMDVDIEPRGLW